MKESSPPPKQPAAAIIHPLQTPNANPHNVIHVPYPSNGGIDVIYI